MKLSIFRYWLEAYARLARRPRLGRSGSTELAEVLALPVLLMLVSAFCGCALTPNVDTRKPGQKWNYYGDLTSFYRDETRGSPVALVWLEQVQFTQVDPGQFQKTVRALLTQGYRKIGFISVRSQYFVDPYDAKKLAADKGARMVVGCWFSVPTAKAGAFAYHAARAKSNVVEYWYQLLDKPSLPPPVAAPSVRPVVRSRPRLY
jgi:hypothetical protein